MNYPYIHCHRGIFNYSVIAKRLVLVETGIENQLL